MILPDLPQLTIDRITIETISSHKLLGLQIQDDLKWNEHVDIITKKDARHLYIIRTLKRNRVPEDDLISIIYTSLIRSVLNYGCAVWLTRLPSFLVEKIERLQKWFFRIIFPDHLTVKLDAQLLLDAQDLKTTVNACVKNFLINLKLGQVRNFPI